MRVLVLGATGMLGHKLVQRLNSRFDVWSTVRGAEPPAAAAAAGILDPATTLVGVRADVPESVAAAIDRCSPDVVVNAIGIVKQRGEATAAVPSIRINALFPHELTAACAQRRARLVHISTDCVFSGARGGYVEGDRPDACDLYGRTKLLGEVVAETRALTLRTSIVGRELHGAAGLVEWFLAQRGGRVRGFSRAMFSGLTTAALADVIGDVVEREPDLHGLWHVGAAPIDKHAFLIALREATGADVEIDPDPALMIDRSLDSDRFRVRVGWAPPSWERMLGDLAADPTPYEELRAP